MILHRQLRVSLIYYAAFTVVVAVFVIGAIRSVALLLLLLHVKIEVDDPGDLRPPHEFFTACRLGLMTRLVDSGVDRTPTYCSEALPLFGVAQIWVELVPVSSA